MTAAGVFEELAFDTGEVKINYARFPKNGPPLLFIHGVTSTWGGWDAIIPHFTADWQCYAMDLRGHGKSGHIPGQYHRDKYAADAAKLITDVIGEPTVVVGSSLGATTAMTTASLIPDMVKAVIFSDPPMLVHRRPGEHARERFARRLEQIRAAKSPSDLFDMARQQVESDEAARERASGWLKMDVNVLESTIDGSAVAGWDVEGQLRRVTSRALLLQADPETGGVLSDEEAARTAELLADCTHIKWSGCGHSMHHEFPQRFVDTVKEFLANA